MSTHAKEIQTHPWLMLLSGFRLTKKQAETLTSLLQTPPRFIGDDLFSDTKALSSLIKRHIVLTPGIFPTPQQEKILFLQMNYARYLINLIIAPPLKNKRPTRQVLLDLLQLNKKQLAIRGQIATSNIGLVLSMAKKCKYNHVEFSNFISEGSMALLKAVEGFNVSLGWKFSTYACKAIGLSFVRVAKKTYTYRDRFSVQLEPDMIQHDASGQKRATQLKELAEEAVFLVSSPKANLTPIERKVLQLRFLSISNNNKQPTLCAVGVKLGLTKERIRQIQKNALAKLHSVLRHESLC